MLNLVTRILQRSKNKASEGSVQLGRTWSLHVFSIFSLAAIYFITTFRILTDNHFPIRDSWGYHSQNFFYFANALSQGVVPRWYSGFGGVPTLNSSATLAPILPHRLFGYIIFNFTTWDPAFIYKISLFFGMMSMVGGWWCVLWIISRSRRASFVGCLMLLLGGLGLTVHHHDHILTATFWYPWMVLCLLHLKSNPKLLLPLFGFMGLQISVLYPTIHLVTYSLIFSGLLLTRFRDVRDFSRTLLKRPLLVGASFILFFLSASTIIYVYKELGKFGSPLRHTNTISVKSLESYLQLNRLQLSSTQLSYFKNLVIPGYSNLGIDLVGQDDVFLVYLTFAGFIFLLWGLFRFQRRMRVVALVALGLLWATLGIHGYLAQLLFVIGFPTVSYFRQWYHFMPLLLLALSIFGCLGCRDFLDITSRRPRWQKIGTGIFVLFMIFDGFRYAEIYRKRFRTDQEKHGYRHEPSGLSVEIENQTFNDISSYQTSIKLFKSCEAFRFWRKPMFVREIASLNQDPELLNCSLPQGEQLGPSEFLFSPTGLDVQRTFESQGTILLPYNQQLFPNALVNGRLIATLGLFGGAITGVPVPRGQAHVQMVVPDRSAIGLFSIQLTSMMLCMCFFFHYLTTRSHRIDV